MQRAVALRSYFQSLRVRAVVISLLSSLLEGAPKPRLPAYEDSALCRAFDTTFSEEELQGVAVPDPADIERLRQICQRGGERLWLEHSAPPCAPAPSPPPPYPPCAQLGLDRRPFTAPAGAFERGWLLVTERAELRYQQSQLEYSTRQQAQRLLQLHGGEGGGGEVSPPAAHAAGSPAPPA
eukprot:scaffold74898_cov74-Phaeocystis_antarctica.AAC.2